MHIEMNHFLPIFAAFIGAFISIVIAFTSTVAAHKQKSSPIRKQKGGLQL